ncbi:MAG: HAD-IIB family hydrolase [Acidobacteria bacterium]|nr:HAD-IIB family hydrolase [Acidobacteriota bacterium]
MPIRLVAIDIDGTLLDSRWRLPERNRTAIAAAVDAGVEVALVTGRRYDFAKPIIELLPRPVTAIVSNGALVRLPDASTPIRHLLPCETARRVLEATAEYRAGAGIIFDRPKDGQVVFERIDWTHPSRRGYVEANRGFVVEVDPLEAALTEDPIQVMFNGGVVEMRDLASRLRALPDARAFAVSVTEYEARDFSLVDVLAAGCTKGRTLSEWAGRRGIVRGDILALGDNLNDREMLEAAGQPVVMGNAVPALLATGWPVTASSDDAGVADAIERFVLSAS